MYAFGRQSRLNDIRKSKGIRNFLKIEQLGDNSIHDRVTRSRRRVSCVYNMRLQLTKSLD